MAVTPLSPGNGNCVPKAWHMPLTWANDWSLVNMRDEVPRGTRSTNAKVPKVCTHRTVLHHPVIAVDGTIAILLLGVGDQRANTLNTSCRAHLQSCGEPS